MDWSCHKLSFQGERIDALMQAGIMFLMPGINHFGDTDV